tara:strand:- start:173 stop:592 length:420 start_codon:yes stop_codon:yes gene_type:complete
MADINLLTYNTKIEECIHPVDFDDAATTGDYVSMKNYDAVTVFIYTGTFAGTGLTVTVEQCTQDADAGSDAKAISPAKTITGAANTIASVNIAGEEMDADGNFDWLKVTCTDPGSAAIGCVFVIGYRSRWAEATMPALV